jgi:hypothetical protein
MYHVDAAAAAAVLHTYPFPMSHGKTEAKGGVFISLQCTSNTDCDYDEAIEQLRKAMRSFYTFHVQERLQLSYNRLNKIDKRRNGFILVRRVLFFANMYLNKHKGV